MLVPTIPIPSGALDEEKVTAKLEVVSRLVILTYFKLLDGKVPAPGFTPFTLIKSIDVVGGTVTILLSTLVILPIV